MEPPKIHRIGPLATADSLEAVLAFCVASRVRQGIGTTIHETKDGTAVNVGGTSSGGINGALLPLEPFIDTATGPKAIALTPGTIGGLTVGSVGSPYAVGTASGTGIIEATLTTNLDGEPSSVSVALKSGATPTADDATHFHLTVGTYDGTGAAAVVSRVLGGSQSFMRCISPYSSPTEYVGTWQLI